MNVNPFSYLIEKLKGKVDKSGDTMTGDLTIDKGSGSSYFNLGGANSYGTIRFYTVNSYRGNLYFDTLSANRVVVIPDKSGTLALTSDLATVSDGSYTASSSYPLDGSATIKVNNKVATLNAVLATLTADASGAFVQVGTVSPSPVANTYFPVFNGHDTTPLGYGYIASTGKVYMHKNYLKSGKMPVVVATYIAQ